MPFAASTTGHAFPCCFAKQLVEYRVPQLFNLRIYPYELADIVSNQYGQWRIENAYLMGEVTFKRWNSYRCQHRIIMLTFERFYSVARGVSSCESL